jgi:hypothetical protein
VVGGRGNRNTQLAATESLHAFKDFIGFRDDFIDSLREPMKYTPRICKIYAPPHVLEKWKPNIFFELANLHGNGRLGEEQFFGGAREAELSGNSFKRLELAEGEIHYVPLHVVQDRPAHEQAVGMSMCCDDSNI